MLRKNTISVLSTFGIIIVVWLVYRFYAVTQHPGIAFVKTIAYGLGLICAIGLVAVARALTRSRWFKEIGESRFASEAGAYASLGHSKQKSITIDVAVRSDNIRELLRDGQLFVPSDRFTMPVRLHDTVVVRAIDAHDSRSVRTTVTEIDGVGLRILLQKLP